MGKRVAALLGSIVTIVAIAGPGCGDDDDPPEEVVVGHTDVDLELTEILTRNQEAPIGNLVADAFLEATSELGAQAAMINGGSLRCPEEFDEVQCVGWSIPAGEITEDQLATVLSFDGALTIKTVTGAQLRSTLERSVSSIPSERKGWFLHVAGLEYEADCSLGAQQLNADNTSIVTEGVRVTDIEIAGEPVDDGATYEIAVPAFIGAGSDGHVQLGEAEGEDLTTTDREAVRAYLAAHDPVAPAVEGRIELSDDCVAE